MQSPLVNTFRNRLIWISISFILLVTLNAGLGYWVTSFSRQLLDRIQLAHSVHKQYLILSAQTHELFRELIRLTIFSGDAKVHDSEAIVLDRQAVDTTLDQIRKLIAAEISATNGADRINEERELQFLAIIERKLGHILSEFEEVSTLIRTNQFQTAGTRLINTLEISVDHEFGQLINRALAKEIKDVEQTEQEMLTRLTRLHGIMLLNIILALVLGGVAYQLSTRRLHNSLELLLQGTRKLAQGDMYHHLSIPGKDEFTSIAVNFNHMADQIKVRQQQLENIHQHLALKVEQASQELREANDSLVRLHDSRQKLFADISHELRTPITVIRGEVQFALRGAEKTVEVCQETLKHVLEQSLYLERLVDDLLFIARTDAGALPFRRERVQLYELFDSVCADAAVIARNRGIEIDFQTTAKHVLVAGDAGRLRQLFLILLENAIRYANTDSRIIVSMERSEKATGEFCLINICDRGKGILEEELPLVFERYFRGQHASMMNNKGSGLGLPMARAIVEAHGGKIGITSQIDHGTTVLVELPILQMTRTVMV